MSDTMIQTNETAPAAPPVKRSYAVQSTRIAKRIARAQTMLQVVANDAGLQQALAAHGYDAAKLAEGTALCQTAQNLYNLRLIDRTNVGVARIERSLQYLEAIRAYNDFRVIARAQLSDKAHQQALTLDDELPRNSEVFVPHARAAYNAALTTVAIAQTLEKYGFTPERLTAELARVDALSEAVANERLAVAGSKHTVADRDAAGRQLGAWLHSFRSTARVATRNQPYWQGALGL